jgi:membrane associated rhomboid family serine protease
MGALVLLIVGGAALYFTTAEERARTLQLVVSQLRQLRKTIDQHRLEPEPYRDALRARAPLPVATIGLVALNVLAFAVVVAGGANLSDAEGLASWGGNFGPRTTNGEWWRLVSAAFLHGGVLQLAVNVVALGQVGVLLERLAGRLALVSVYLIAGILAGLVNLVLHPMAVSAGASASVFGLYGLLASSTVWTFRRRSDVTMSWDAARRLLTVAAVFVFVQLVSGGFGAAGRTGLLVGAVIGGILSREIGERQPPPLRVGAVAAVALIVAAVSAMPLRGITDVRPELRRVVEIEGRTAHDYDLAATQFRLGAVNAKALAQLIDGTILPELRQARTRVKALVGVPPEHQPLVASAEEYLRLRDESWRLRSEALHKANMNTLRKADRAERDSLDAFQKIKPADQGGG